MGLASESAVREAGVVPATVGVLDGKLVIGLTATELGRFDESGTEARPTRPRGVDRAGRRRRDDGRWNARGLQGGADHASWRQAGSGACTAVGRPRRTCQPTCARSSETRVLVVSSGVKSLLDVAATSELLETLGIPVLGWRTDTLPLFYSAHGGPGVSARVESAEEAAKLAAAHWQLDGGGLLLGRPPDESLDDVEPLIERALAEAAVREIHGQAVTPFVLSYLHRESDGRTLRANRDLIVGNARLAGEIAAVVTTARV